MSIRNLFQKHYKSYWSKSFGNYMIRTQSRRQGTSIRGAFELWGAEITLCVCVCVGGVKVSYLWPRAVADAR